MAGILNNTARQFNLKCIGANGNRVTVRVAPGFNVVEVEVEYGTRKKAYS